MSFNSKILENKTGFISAHWDGTAETEETIKEKNSQSLKKSNNGNKSNDNESILLSLKSIDDLSLKLDEPMNSTSEEMNSMEFLIKMSTLKNA